MSISLINHFNIKFILIVIAYIKREDIKSIVRELIQDLLLANTLAEYNKAMDYYLRWLSRVSVAYAISWADQCALLQTTQHLSTFAFGEMCSNE